MVNPLNDSDANKSVALSAYASDSEANMTFVTLRDKLLNDADTMVNEDGTTSPVWNGNGFVLFTDIDGTLKTAESYESIGPKEEVYMYSGQSVTFSLTGENGWDPNSNTLYLGIKAPTGSGTVTIGSTTLTITNAADCYYDITKYGAVTTDETTGVKTITFTITAGENCLISLTNIKVTGNAEFTIYDSNVNVEGDENTDEIVEGDE